MNATNHPPARPGAVLGTGLGLGLLGDALLRAPGAPALNLFLWAAALAAAVALLLRRGGGQPSAEAAALLGVGLFFAATLAWRDSPALKLLALAATAGAFALPALEAGAAWVSRSGVTRYGLAVAVAGVRSVLGPVPALVDVDWAALRERQASGARLRHAGAVARGVVLALPLLLVFGGLFIAADAVFAELVVDFLRIDLERLASHLVLVGFFGSVAAGYAYGFVTGTRLPVPRSLAARRPWLGLTEVGIALGLLAALFAVFVAVQFRYLFGGAALVGVTPGLTYAEYARRGFFELVVVVALMLPVLLAADWLLRRERPRDDAVFRTLAAVQLVLLVAVMASALQRMRLYLDAYGLTEARFYATSFLLWLTVVLVWFVATVLRGRRDSFAFGALVSAFAVAALLVAINPDAMIARTNLARQRAGEVFDAQYVTYLSGDAVPVLVPALPGLPVEARCRIAQRLLVRWAREDEPDWRNWSWGAARARAVVRAHALELGRFAQECPPPGR
ncbi:MAG TPA: DUF4173 domain-containing protein [Longimicrobiales bacterium]